MNRLRVGRPWDRERRIRLALITATVGFLVLVPVQTLQLLSLADDASVGIDYRPIMEASQRWVAGESFYPARQLEGPYVRLGLLPDGTTEINYPPIALYLFVPFTILPALLWWALPLGLIALALLRMRPAMWTWPILAFLLYNPKTQEVIIAGNPGMWVTAGVAWGLLLGWPALMVAIKPSLGPLAFVGIRHRSWWIAVGVVAIAALPFGLGMWLDWIAGIRNMTNGSVLYSAHELWINAIPIVAWLGSEPGGVVLASVRRRLSARLGRSPAIRPD